MNCKSSPRAGVIDAGTGVLTYAEWESMLNPQHGPGFGLIRAVQRATCNAAYC